MYAKGIEKISKSLIFEKSTGALNNALGFYKSYLNQQVILLNNISEQCTSEFIVSIKKFLAQQDLAIKEKYEIGKKLVAERAKLVKLHLKAKEKYLKAPKEAEYLPYQK